MTILTTAFNTSVTPTKVNFSVAVNGGGAVLQAQPNASGPWYTVGPIDGFTLVDNPVLGTAYRVVPNNVGIATAVVVDE